MNLAGLWLPKQSECGEMNLILLFLMCFSAAIDPHPVLITVQVESLVWILPHKVPQIPPL